MRNSVIGTGWDIINQPIDASSFVEITYDKPVVGFTFKERDLKSFFHKRTEAATAYVKYMGQGLRDQIQLSDANAASASLGWFKMESGSGTIEVYVVF